MAGNSVEPAAAGVTDPPPGCTLISCSSTTSNGMSRSCKTTIPSGFKVLNLTFETKLAADRCTHGFVAEDEWLQKHKSGLTMSLKEADYYAPVVVLWGVFNNTAEATRMLNDKTIECNEIYQGESSLACRCNYVEGNPYLPNGCQVGCHGCISSQLKFVIIGFGSSLGLVILIIVVWSLYKIIKKRIEIRRKKEFFKRNGGLLLEQQLNTSELGNVETAKVFTSKELEMATDHFNKNRILGQGGQGTVYKGMLPDGRTIAVKKEKIGSKEGKFVEQFINEVVILSQINHRNIVKLIGCCLETEVPLLAYEFVPNGTLFQYLHDQNDDLELIVSWKMRLKIAIEVAGALSYLHSAASIPIYHRDIKSTNILLDDKYRAKVADFGTSRSVAIDETHLTTRVQGTFGYLDPEYFQSSQFTDKSDVYSFGVVLVELLTGQKPISFTRPEEDMSLVSYFITSMEENRLFDILDARLLAEEGEKKGEIVAVANLARKCLDSHGRNRPTMREVNIELESMSACASQKCGGHYEESEYGSTRETDDLQPWNAVSSFTETEYEADNNEMALLPSETW